MARELETDDVLGNITALVSSAAAGDAAAANDLVGLIYDELRRLAASLLRHERAGHTLQPTALVHEAVLRLLGPEQLTAISNRRMLFSAAARAMRQVLVDYARQRKALKRGKQWRRAAFDQVIDQLEASNVQFDALDAAMEQLQAADPRGFEVVDLRFFGALSISEIAALLEVSTSTVEKDLNRCRTFLRQCMT